MSTYELDFDTRIEGEHVWVSNSGQGGPPRYKPGPNGPKAPHCMHVRCRNTGARTWITEERWNRLQAAPKAPPPSAAA